MSHSPLPEELDMVNFLRGGEEKAFFWVLSLKSYNEQKREKLHYQHSDETLDSTCYYSLLSS